MDVREEMTRRAIATITRLMEKPRKRNAEDNTREAGAPGVTYTEVLDHLQKSLAHLGTLGHSFILELQKSEQVRPQQTSAHAPPCQLCLSDPFPVFQCQGQPCS